MIYGNPSYRIESDQTDRIGIRTLTISTLWQPSRGDMTIAQMDEEAPPPPTVAAGVRFVGRQTHPDGGALRTRWMFEGIDGDGKSVTFKDRARSEDYSFQPGFSQKSIML